MEFSCYPTCKKQVGSSSNHSFHWDRFSLRFRHFDIINALNKALVVRDKNRHEKFISSINHIVRKARLAQSVEHKTLIKNRTIQVVSWGRGFDPPGGLCDFFFFSP